MDRFIESENEVDAPSADSLTKRKTPSIDSGAPVVPNSPEYTGLKHPRKYSFDPELPPLRENEAELVVDIVGFVDSVNHGELDSNGYGRLELESESVALDGLTFRLVCFLTRRLDDNEAPCYDLGLYVKVSPPVPDGDTWSYRSVSMMVMLVNANNPYSDESRVFRDTCQFSSNDPCRGWSSIVSFSSINELEEMGFLFQTGLIKARGQASFEGSAIVSDQSAPPYCGLENMGATCYLAALLQSLFHIGSFRQLVYSSPSADDSDILSALQCVFSDLEESDSGVSAEPLTHAFGWDLADVGVQHDAQELNRILIDRIESLHKDQVSDLFSGELENYIECLDVEYTSRRVEKFYDLQMNLISHNGGEAKPITSLQEAIDQYLAPEILDGPNMYDAESFGKQRARKGVRFVSLPPVLSFQLMRFQFDYETLEMKKINTRFDFPETLILSQSEYVLHSVLVHSGNVHAGHYYAYVRPDGRTDWYKFDDTEVRKVDSFTAVENNFGGQPIVTDKLVNYLNNDQPPTANARDKVYSAYMLTYVRSDMASSVLRDAKFSNLPEFVKEGISGRKKNLKEKLAETAKRSSRRKSTRRGSSSGESSSPDDEVVPTRIIRLDGEKRVFDSLVTSTDSIKSSWLCEFPSSVPYHVSGDCIVDVPGSELIGTALKNLMPVPPGGCQIFYMISDPENRVRFLEISENETLSASMKDLSRHVSPSPIVLVVSPTTDVGEPFFVVEFDPAVRTFEFRGLIVVPEKSDELGREIRSAILAQVWGKDACEFFAHTRHYNLESLETAAVDGGMFIVLQKKFAHMGEENAKEYMSTLSNTFELDVYVHDAIRDTWILGEVPAVEHALLPNGKSTDSLRPIEHLKISMDVRNEVCTIGDVIPGFNGEIADLLVFCDDPLLDEVRAGEDVNQEGWKLIDVIGRRGLQLHCAAIPKRPDCGDEWMESKPICVRFFSEKVVEEKCVVLHVTPVMTVSDIVRYCKECFGSHVPCRMLEIDVHDCEIITEHIEGDQSVATTLMCWGARNILASSLRIEPLESTEMEDVTPIRCHHFDRTSRRRFGHPFLIFLPSNVEQEKREAVLRDLVAQKLDIPPNIVRGWKLAEWMREGFISLEISHSSNPWTTKGTPRERGLVIKG